MLMLVVLLSAMSSLLVVSLLWLSMLLSSRGCQAK